MSSYRQTLFQFVFRPKNSNPSIEEANEVELFKYISGIVKNCNGKTFAINGMPDHIHILSDLPPTLSIADYIKTIKVASSLWMKSSGKFPRFDGWQVGYGAFTYSIRDMDRLVKYIMNQKEHHKSETSVDEYKRLLKEHGIDFDERFLF